MSEPKIKGYTFGTCSFDRTSPHRSTLSSSTRVLNILVSFEDALKLNIAVHEAVRKLNSFNRATKEGRRTALNLTLHLDKNRITVNQGTV